MRVATGEQSCKRQRFAFSFAGKKGMWFGMQQDRNARFGNSSAASDHRSDAQVYDARLHTTRLTGINVLSFRHPGYAAPLWLVVARPGGGKEPWYLVTNSPVPSVDEGWRMIFAYARRWQIELAFRYTKCE